MKWYVVSEKELNRLVALCIDHGMTDSYDLIAYHKTADEYLEAEAACRARPIPEELLVVLGLPSKYDLEMKILKDTGD